MTKSSFNKLTLILFILYLGAVLFVHVMHADDFKDLNNYFLGIRNDHWLHGILFFPLGFLIRYVFTSWKIILPFGIFCCIFFETLQYFLPYRSFEFTDILSDTTGAIIGLLVYFATRKIVVKVFGMK